MNSCRPAVDVLFGSVAEVFGRRALVAMLTGMGSDGLGGSERVVAAGGTVVAQDRASSVVWGMPGAVVEAGLADWVGPLPRLTAELVRRADVGRGGASRADGSPAVMRSTAVGGWAATFRQMVESSGSTIS